MASCASSRLSTITMRPGIGGGTAAARMPRLAHSIGSSTWNNQRCGSAANAVCVTAPGRSIVATVWIPAAAPSVSTRNHRPWSSASPGPETADSKAPRPSMARMIGGRGTAGSACRRANSSAR